MFVDIRGKDAPDEEKFYVDTNVWYWATYIPSKSFIANPPKDYQAEHYPNFIESVLNNNSELYFSPITLIELSNIIERAEWEIYKATHNDSTITLKRFRKITAERKAVVDEIKTAWDSISTMAKMLPTHIEEGLSNQIMETLESEILDGYDALYFHIMKVNNITNIITDDKDFRGIDGVNLYGCYER